LTLTLVPTLCLGTGEAESKTWKKRDFDTKKLEAPPAEQFNFSLTSASISEN
jgi:hypothetical protein